MENARGGAFCKHHEQVYGHICRIIGCQNNKVDGTQACVQHQPEWKKHQAQHSHANFTGICRQLKDPNDPYAWQTQNRNSQDRQPHDEPASKKKSKKKNNYFTSGRFYCVETICAPCGAVIAWKKFDVAESPKNIMDFLDEVYPDKKTRPAYICIDKACVVLKTVTVNPKYSPWLDTS